MGHTVPSVSWKLEGNAYLSLLFVLWPPANGCLELTYVNCAGRPSGMKFDRPSGCHVIQGADHGETREGSCEIAMLGYSASTSKQFSFQSLGLQSRFRVVGLCKRNVSVSIDSSLMILILIDRLHSA